MWDCDLHISDGILMFLILFFLFGNCRAVYLIWMSCLYAVLAACCFQAFLQLTVLLSKMSSSGRVPNVIFCLCRSFTWGSSYMLQLWHSMQVNNPEKLLFVLSHFTTCVTFLTRSSNWTGVKSKEECGWLCFILLMSSLRSFAVTGFDLWGAVLAMGLVCTLYTTLVSCWICSWVCPSQPMNQPLFSLWFQFSVIICSMYL